MTEKLCSFEEALAILEEMGERLEEMEECPAAGMAYWKNNPMFRDWIDRLSRYLCYKPTLPKEVWAWDHKPVYATRKALVDECAKDGLEYMADYYNLVPVIGAPEPQETAGEGAYVVMDS